MQMNEGAMTKNMHGEAQEVMVQGNALVHISLGEKGEMAETDDIRILATNVGVCAHMELQAKCVKELKMLVCTKD